jgi:phosphatidylserine decarboxylase
MGLAAIVVVTPSIEESETRGGLKVEDENVGDDKDEDDDDDNEKDLETSDETDDPAKPASTEKRKKKLRLARLKKKSKKRGYEFSGGSDVVGIVFLDIGRITDLPPERNSVSVISLSPQ